MFLNRPNITRYAYDRGDFEGLRQHLHDTDWSEVANDTSNTNVKWEAFKSIVQEGIDKFIPKVQIRTTPTQRKHVGPLDQKALAKIRKKHRLWQRYMETKEGKRYEEYCRVRNQVRQLTRKAKMMNEKSIADQAK